MLHFLPRTIRANLFIRAAGLTRIPMLGFLRPLVVRYDDDVVTIRMALSRRARNHLGSMYIGALCTGADCAGGLLAMDLAARHRGRLKVAFTEMRAEFLKRADDDVDFTCADGRAIASAVDRALASGQRENVSITVVARGASRPDAEPMARFSMLLTVRAKT